MSEFHDLLADNPVIAAVKDDKGLEECLAIEDMRIVFLLYGDVINLAALVQRVKEAGRMCFVHVDLINGLSGRDIVVQYIKQCTAADGIISTKPALISEAGKLGLYTVLRVFLLDSMAYQNIDREIQMSRPDCIEVLPGLMPKIIRKINARIRIPLIAGGLITDKEDVMGVLEAGAAAASSTRPEVWRL